MGHVCFVKLSIAMHVHGLQRFMYHGECLVGGALHPAGWVARGTATWKKRPTPSTGVERRSMQVCGRPGSRAAETMPRTSGLMPSPSTAKGHGPNKAHHHTAVRPRRPDGEGRRGVSRLVGGASGSRGCCTNIHKGDWPANLLTSPLRPSSHSHTACKLCSVPVSTVEQAG